MTSHNAVSQTGPDGREREINEKLRKHEFCPDMDKTAEQQQYSCTIIQLTGCIEDTLYHEGL
jgi:hypothetical protein